MKRKAKGWASEPLAELSRAISEERDSARWLTLARAASRVAEAIEEERKVAVAAIEAEKRLAQSEISMPVKQMAHDYPTGHRGEGSGHAAIIKGRRLKQDKRNKQRRRDYVPTGRKAGRPRIYQGGRAGRGGNHLRYRGEWVY